MISYSKPQSNALPSRHLDTQKYWANFSRVKTLGEKKRIAFDEKRNETISYSPHSSVFHQDTPHILKNAFLFPSDARPRNKLSFDSSYLTSFRKGLHAKKTTMNDSTKPFGTKRDSTQFQDSHRDSETTTVRFRTETPQFPQFRDSEITENSEIVQNEKENCVIQRGFDTFDGSHDVKRDSFIELEMKMANLDKEKEHEGVSLHLSRIHGSDLAQTEPTFRMIPSQTGSFLDLNSHNFQYYDHLQEGMKGEKPEITSSAIELKRITNDRPFRRNRTSKEISDNSVSPPSSGIVFDSKKPKEEKNAAAVVAASEKNEGRGLLFRERPPKRLLTQDSSNQDEAQFIENHSIRKFFKGGIGSSYNFLKRKNDDDPSPATIPSHQRPKNQIEKSMSIANMSSRNPNLRRMERNSDEKIKKSHSVYEIK